MTYFVVKTAGSIHVIDQQPRRGDLIVCATPDLERAFRVLTKQPAEPDVWDRWIHRISAFGLVALLLFAPAIVEDRDRPTEPEKIEVTT